jgi:iron complex transport system ATP-binding protein
MLKIADVSFSYGDVFTQRARSSATAHLSLRSLRSSRETVGSRGMARPVLDRVSFDVERGTIVGLLGPNGSGKTTLLRVVAGVLRPQSGAVMFGGEPIDRLARRDLARRVASVPQETHATFDFTVIEMVLMGRYPHLGPFELEGAADQEIARAALAATGTAELESRAFATLSGGEKQRVVIAAALAQASDMLLLDEPTAALDLAYQFEIAALLRRLNAERGTTMIVSTHDLNLAAALCDRIVLLKQGRIVAQGATREALTAEHIRLLYDVDADVQFHPRAGHLTVVPIGRSQ